MNLRYFKDGEFRKAVPSCSLSDMNERFMQKLDIARGLAGVPFLINSAFRSSEYDLSKGRSGKGFHTLGRAVDVACRDSVSRMKIVSACVELGLSCGVAGTFIHIDDRCISDGYVDPLLWTY